MTSKLILVRRVLTPMLAVRWYYRWKHSAEVSSRAEVDLAGGTAWGEGCVIEPFSKVKIAGPFEMGRRVHIATGCFIHADRLILGDDVVVSPNCTIVAANYRFDQLDVPLADQGTTTVGIRIGHRVRLGANSVVLDGAEIGDDVLVEAGSVVSGTIPPATVVQGNPARVISSRAAGS